MYGHVGKLAEEIKKGAESIEGVEAKLWQVCKPIIKNYRVLILFFGNLENQIKKEKKNNKKELNTREHGPQGIG